MREKLFAMKHKAATALAVVPAMLALSTTAFAAVGENTAGQDISTALASGLNDVVAQMITMIATLLPSALTVLGAMLVVKKGISFFKTVSNKAG